MYSQVRKRLAEIADEEAKGAQAELDRRAMMRRWVRRARAIETVILATLSDFKKKGRVALRIPARGRHMRVLTIATYAVVLESVRARPRSRRAQAIAQGEFFCAAHHLLSEHYIANKGGRSRRGGSYDLLAELYHGVFDQVVTHDVIKKALLARPLPSGVVDTNWEIDEAWLKSLSPRETKIAKARRDRRQQRAKRCGS